MNSSSMEPSSSFPMNGSGVMQRQRSSGVDLRPLAAVADQSFMISSGQLPIQVASQPVSVEGSALKICAVCGDRALSCNFGAITCESCKAFFRRNGARVQETYSRCDERCVLTVQSRSQCKRCRLLKCFSVGMRADLILTDEQKRDRRKKIAENRNKRLLSGGATSVDGVSSTENKSTSQDGTMRESSSRTMSCTSSEDSSLKQSNGQSPPQHLASPDEGNHSVNNRGNGSEQRSPESSTEVATYQRHTSSQSLRSSGESSSSFIAEEVPIKKVRSDDELTAASAGKAADEMNSEKAPAASGHAITQDADLTTIKLMSAENAELIYNMTRAFRQSFDQPVTQPQALKSEGTTLDFLNMADLTIRRLVKMARHLPHFCALDQPHQIDLLRGCSVDVLLLRSVKNFDPSRQGWMTQTSEKKQFVSANTFKSDPTVGAEYYMGYARATVALQDAIRRDAIVLMLIMVLRLFNPKNLEDPDELEAVLACVERSRAAYISATKEYLVVKYDDTDGSLYATIIEKLEAFVLLGTFHHELLKHVKACDLKPLIAEVFDVS